MGRAVEQIGLIPRSIIRTFDRFRKQLLKGNINSAKQEFRISRYQLIVSIKSFTILLVVPVVVTFLARNCLILPLISYLWNTQQNEIFLNTYQENRAFSELHDFEEKLFFESLIKTQLVPSETKKNEFQKHPNFLEYKLKTETSIVEKKECLLKENQKNKERKTNKEKNDDTLKIFLNQKFQQKTIDLACYYNKQSIEAIANFFGEGVRFFTISLLFLFMEPQIVILKTFLLESIYSLSDTTKSFLLILLTDLLVGFHSPDGWKFFIEVTLRYLGLPESKTFVFLFVATFPVVLDTLFKYWIFRHLNRISPSTVATYHNMLE